MAILGLFSAVFCSCLYLKGLPQPKWEYTPPFCQLKLKSSFLPHRIHKFYPFSFLHNTRRPTECKTLLPTLLPPTYLPLKFLPLKPAYRPHFHFDAFNDNLHRDTNTVTSIEKERKFWSSPLRSPYAGLWPALKCEMWAQHFNNPFPSPYSSLSPQGSISYVIRLLLVCF